MDFLYYVATMKSADSEDDARIIRHKQERDGWGFTTVEQPVDIENILQKCDCNGSFLLDSLTAILANEMFPPPDYAVNEKAAEKIRIFVHLFLDKGVAISQKLCYNTKCCCEKTRRQSGLKTVQAQNNRNARRRVEIL
jgi:adenosyl cobinamide kinase/adenosyl cobinamide phosphate guanylyltransferase